MIGRLDPSPAMLDHYLPRQGLEFETWLDRLDTIGARIAAEKMFTFAMEADAVADQSLTAI